VANLLAEDPDRKGMKGADPDIPRFSTSQLLDPLAHFGSSTVRKGNGQDSKGRYP
jgi:hypothetical protein